MIITGGLRRWLQLFEDKPLASFMHSQFPSGFVDFFILFVSSNRAYKMPALTRWEFLSAFHMITAYRQRHRNP